MSGFLTFLEGFGGALASLFSARDTNLTNLQIADMANRTNMSINEANLQHADEAATTAYNRQQEFYNMYQSPSAMMRQLKEAGLSPGLMYGQGGTGGSGGTSVAQAVTPSPIPMQAAVMKPIFDAQLATMLSQIEKTKAETRKTEVEAAKGEAELPKIQQETKNLEETNNLIKENIRKTGQEINNLITEQAATLAQKGKTEEETNLLKLQQQYQNLQNQLVDKEINWFDERSKAEIDEIAAHIKEMNALAAKAGAERKAILEQNVELVKLYKNQAIKAGLEAKYIVPKEIDKLQKDIDKEIEEIAAIKNNNERAKAINRYYEGWKRINPNLADALRWFCNSIPFGRDN